MKRIINFCAVVLMAATMTSCGTVFGGHISTCQKTKPAPAMAKRQIRPWALVGDLVSGGLWVIIDFVDGGMYKPCDTASAKK